MSDAILQGVAADIAEADAALDTATELIDAMKEAGEDVSEMESTVRALRTRKNKWVSMLKARGITPEKA